MTVLHVPAPCYIAKRTGIPSRSGSVDIPRLLWNQKVHYSVHNSPALVSILSHVNTLHTLTPFFFESHSHLFLSMPTSPKWSLPLGFSD
jgi:alanine dehydrogenase